MPRISAATVAEHRARQRRAILDAAREIIAENGHGSPSLADVAKRTGLARSSVYQYFDSRDDLLTAVIADVLPRWADYVTARMQQAEDPGGRVLAYVSANLHLVATGEHAIARALAEVAPREPLAQSSRDMHNALLAPVVDALRELGASDPEAIAELIQSVVYAASRMVESGMPERSAVAHTSELLAPYLTCRNPR
ncbi:AcrR family transcriptional regulator [Saccharomonospora amisosensis]|uniref:AcrR family transcriptional regulator n=1 Tax=Saccharomonospora amisosensis TaxID=1128677 RepID=A0A7X5UMP4_9PSEU|nr:TetR/AcrR family transcriptional regulator [Saccharomonospora amisosensis]NIJ10846.1 AcrR family transcriptional regulator [Saccharomonospora amisosensis]